MRRTIAYAVLVVGLVVGGVAAVPASGVTLHRGGLLDPLNPPLPAEASVWARDGVLGQGGQRAAFRYRVETAETSWALELFLIDPTGRQVASSYQNVGGDPASGRDLFRFSSHSTRPGRFTIRAKLSWGDYDRAERWLEPRHFRLRAR